MVKRRSLFLPGVKAVASLSPSFFCSFAGAHASEQLIGGAIAVS